MCPLQDDWPRVLHSPGFIAARWESASRMWGSCISEGPMPRPIQGSRSGCQFYPESTGMWVKQCHKPPVFGNGKHTTYQYDDLEDGLYLLLFYSHNVNSIATVQCVSRRSWRNRREACSTSMTWRMQRGNAHFCHSLTSNYDGTHINMGFP